MSDHLHDAFKSVVHAADLNRSRSRWRLFAIILALLVFSWWSGFWSSSHSMKGDHIAQINIHGMIVQDLEQENTLDKIANNKNIKAVIMHIDSPGGTMVGGLSLYKAIERIKARKPVVAVMGSTAASAGYLISLAATHTLANEATATGSIGVLMPLVDFSDLAKKVGVKSNFITSGDLKAAGLPLDKMDEKSRTYFQNMVNSMEDIFVKYLTQNRDVTPETLAFIKDGRAIVGYKAKELNLIDGLGGTHEAKNWLINQQHIDATMPIVFTELKQQKPLLEEILGESHIFFKKFVSSFMNYGMVHF